MRWKNFAVAPLLATALAGCAHVKYDFGPGAETQGVKYERGRPVVSAASGPYHAKIKVLNYDRPTGRIKLLVSLFNDSDKPVTVDLDSFTIAEPSDRGMYVLGQDQLRREARRQATLDRIASAATTVGVIYAGQSLAQTTNTSTITTNTGFRATIATSGTDPALSAMAFQAAGATSYYGNAEIGAALTRKLDEIDKQLFVKNTVEPKATYGGIVQLNEPDGLSGMPGDMAPIPVQLALDVGDASLRFDFFVTKYRKPNGRP